jgi:thiamine pyrophosphate-dependent acetolactate synthase large subunit-like protein
LIVLYDDNEIAIDGSNSLSFTEDVQKRYEAYGWHVQEVTDVVTQLDDLRAAIQNAQDCTDKPSLIAVKNFIGYGSPSKGGSHSGTAVANLYPAIIEAGADGIGALLVITADRPYESRGTGANQAIDRVKVFSSTYVRWFRDNEACDLSIVSCCSFEINRCSLVGSRRSSNGDPYSIAL